MRLHHHFSSKLTIFPFVKSVPFSFWWRKRKMIVLSIPETAVFDFAHQTIGDVIVSEILCFFFRTEAFRRKSFFPDSVKAWQPSTFRWEKQTILTLKLINCFASSIKWDFIFFSTHHFHLVKSMTVSFCWRKMENACAVDASNGCFWLCVPNHGSPNRFGNTFFPLREAFRRKPFFSESVKAWATPWFRWEKELV